MYISGFPKVEGGAMGDALYDFFQTTPSKPMPPIGAGPPILK